MANMIVILIVMIQRLVVIMVVMMKHQVGLAALLNDLRMVLVLVSVREHQTHQGNIHLWQRAQMPQADKNGYPGSDDLLDGAHDWRLPDGVIQASGL